MTEKQQSYNRFKKIIISKNLRELMSHFDFEKELDLQYKKGIEFAPDTELFLRDRIKSIEENIKIRKSSVSYGNDKLYELGEYTRIGYSWVIKGIAGSKEDFQLMTCKNLTLNTEIPQDRIYGIYYILLAELARGASTAFHMSFLHKQLTKCTRTNEPDMLENLLLPTFHISENDRLWLTTLLKSSWNNKKMTYRQIKAALKDKLPRNYDPKNISLDLLSDNGEEITILGITQAEKSEEVLKKCDKILMAIQNILLESPVDQKVYASKISELSGLPINEISFLLNVMYINPGLFSSAGSSEGPDYFGYQYVEFDDAKYRAILQIDNTLQAILEKRRKSKLHEIETTSPILATGTDKKYSTAVQVLAIHYLLKKCGVIAVDKLLPTTKLVQFLTGRELNAQRPQNTTVYKHVREPLRLNDKSLIKDLQTIKPFFDDLGITDIVMEIEREIKTSQEAIKPKSNKKK